MNPIYDVLIVGGGPAGYTAALYAARGGLSCVVVEPMSVGGQMTLTDMIDNYPGFEEGIAGFELGMKMQAGAHRFGAETHYGQVLSVDFSAPIKQVTTDSGVYEAKTVILASGANPRPLGLAGEEALVGRGVHYCAHCDGRFYKDKTVAVIGGGNSAVTDALYLAGLAKQVFVIHRRDTLRADKIYHNQLAQHNNIQILWNCKVTDFATDNGRLTGLTLASTTGEESQYLACDGAFVSIGRQPNTDFLQGAVAIDKYGYILADETTCTNVAGVFAAGDVRQKVLRQVITAAADGAVAAHFAGEFLEQQSI